MPAGVAWKAEMIFAYASRGVEYATRVSLVSVVAAAANEPATARATRLATISLCIEGRPSNFVYRLAGDFKF